MTARRKTSNWDKFCLLMWKNWLLQKNNKWQTFLELLTPVMFMGIIVLIRTLHIPVKHMESTTYKPVSIMQKMNLAGNMSHLMPFSEEMEESGSIRSLPVFALAASPNNTILQQVVTVAAIQMGMQTVTMKKNGKSLQKFMLENNYFAAIEFPDHWSNIDQIPKKISYKIRFPGALRTNQDLTDIQHWGTDRIYYYYDIIGPRSRFESDGGIPPGYIREGFASLQNAIALALIDKVKTKDVKIPEIYMRRFPFPPHVYDLLLKDMEGSIAVVLILSFVFPCVCTVKFITLEKEKQLKEVIKIMGLSNWLHWTAWFGKSFIMMGISAILIVVMLKIRWIPGSDVAIFTRTHWSTLVLVMLVYVISAVTFCFMLTTFFAKANTAAAVTGLVWFILYTPYAFTVTEYQNMPDWEKFTCAMISNTAICYVVKMIINLEGKGEGLQWHNILHRTVREDSMTTGILLMMMLSSSVLHLLVCLYVEQIFPGQFGVPRKWYYPFTKEFWCRCRYEVVPDESRRTSRRCSSLGFEREPVGKNAGIHVIHLRKVFGNKIAVNGLDLNVYDNEITVLLGHNGAGKTTTISMLIGMMQPTSGTAKINGYDIVTQTSHARDSLAICPQHNILFEDLTVQEHLIFFAKLKGVPDEEIDAEVQKYANKLGLARKTNVTAKKLSGGMKRKLSLGAALCGGTNVVLCDEPSSGVDPASRRQIWDLLESEKLGRTILLTTHFMDEADVLGDRIAIMSAGSLKCYGTPFFLKKLYGTGYRLICVKQQDCDSSEVTELLRTHIPGIEIVTEVGTELTYNLPYSTSHIFEDMLGELESKSKELKLEGFGISVTSLEDVFMKMGAEKTEMEDESLENHSLNDDQSLYSDEEKSIFERTFDDKASRNMQWRAMLLKKVLSSRRNLRIGFIQAGMPIVFALLAVKVMNSLLHLHELPAIQISFDQYETTLTTLRYSAMDSPIYKEYVNVIREAGPRHQLKEIGNQDFDREILRRSINDLVSVNRESLIGLDMSPEGLIACFNNQPFHTVPLSLNVLHNAILRVATDSSYSIEVTNHPLPYECWVKIVMAQSGAGLGWHLALFVTFCMTFVTSVFSVFIISERSSRAKLLQFVSGVNVTTFWLTHFIWDYVIYLGTAVLCLGTLTSFQQENYKTFEEVGNNFVFFVIFGLAALPFTYFLSLAYNDAPTGFTRIVIFKLIGGTLLFMLVIVLRLPHVDREAAAQSIRDVAVFWPHFCLAECINKINYNIAVTKLCKKICDDTPDCKNLEELCAKKPECCLEPYFGWKKPGILQEMTFMLIQSVVFFLLLLLVDYRLINNLIFAIRRRIWTSHPLPIRTNIDPDIAAENRRIRKMKRKNYKDENLIMKRLTKYYGGFLAVNQLSIAIKEAECFGLLGVNGAGKTTTFKMMTGDERISSGDAYLKGINLRMNMNAAYREIGYCPQFDALLEDLTGREIIRIFCLLRGIPQREIWFVTEQLARGFGFWAHIDKRADVYSGGNKRKLSAALAVLGNPAVIYLDEPTTGMDPAARRQLWNMLIRIRAAGRTIVLTSHSMEECEALCTRMAIMVNGEFKCLGSTQHLKNKFSKGLVLRIKLKLSRLPENEGNLMGVGRSKSDELAAVREMFQRLREGATRIKLFVATEFKNSHLQEEYERILTFYIPFQMETFQWSKMFGLIERNKAKLNIEDYSINQATLEQIFLEFAKMQDDDTRRTRRLTCMDQLKLLFGKRLD